MKNNSKKAQHFKKRFLTLVLAMILLVQTVTPVTAAQDKPVAANTTQAETAIEETIIDVTKYGAVPGGMGDSTVPVQKALEAAKAVNGPVRLYFPKGEYHFYKDFASQREWHTSNTSSLSNPNKWIGILIEEQENLVLDGNDSTFMMHGDIMAIAVARSKNITFENFVLDYEVPDTMDITVVGNGVDTDGKKYTDMYIPANYHYKISEDLKHINWMSEVSPFTGKRYWQDQDTLDGYLVIYKGYDETVRRHSTTVSYEGVAVKDADPFVGLDRIEKIDGNKVRFTYKNRVPEAQEKGNVYLLCNSARRRTAGGFIWESENTLIKNIDVHYLSGFGWLTQMSKDTEFNNVNFLPREGTGKYTTSNADQIHVAGASGYFNVIDCNFSMAHDDPINIHGSYLRVEEVIDDHTLRLKYIQGQQGGFPAYFPGDEVTFYSRLNLEVPEGATEGETFVVASAVNPGEAYEDGKLTMRETVVSFTEAFSPDVKKSLEVKIKRGTNPNSSAEAEPLYVAENVTYAPNVHIKGNVMRSIPTRGILCTTRNEVVIEDNIFESLAMASLYLSNDADYWYESGPIRNMTIRNNTFNVRPTGQTEWATVSPIFIDPVVVNQAVAAPGYELPPTKGDPVHQNINVEGNTFNMRAFNLVTAKGVKGFNFKNNKIYRDTMNMNLTLQADKNQANVGETVNLEASVKEDMLTTDAFIFTNCKDINIENNTYDDGMNLNVKLSGMNKDEVTVLKDPLTIGADSNLITSDSKVQYLSLNPDILQIDKDGKAIARKAGTATVMAYCRWKNSIVRSEKIEITVSGEQQNGMLEITGDDTILEQDGSISLGVSGVSGTAVWSVADAFTGKPTSAATISSDGLLTGSKDGIVKVTASIGTLQGEKIVVISLPESYGIPSGLKPDLSIVNENSEKWKGTGEMDSIKIIGEMGDLYGNNNSAKNIITYTIPEDIPKNDLRVQVTIDGLPKAGDNYNAAGLMLFKDVNNYIRVGTKGHMGNGIATDNEVNGSDTEGMAGSTLTGRKAVLEIEYINGTSRVRYKDLAAGSEWSNYYPISTSDGLSNDYKIALCAWNKDIVALTATFSELKIGQASEVTTEQLEEQEGKALFDSVSNPAPTITNCAADGTILQGETVNIRYDYVDDHAQRDVLYHWTIVNDGKMSNKLTTSPSLTLTEMGLYTCRIYVRDEYGKPCVTPGIVEFNVGANTQETLEIESIYVNGNKLLDYNKDTTEYEYAYPIETSTASISALCKNPSYGTTRLEDSNGAVVGESGEVFTIPDDGIVNIIRSNDNPAKKLNYTIKFTAYDKSDGELSNIKIGDLDCQLIKEGTRGYYAAVDDTMNVVPLTFQTDDGVKEVVVTRSFYNREMKGTLTGTSYTTENINLYSGLNIFNVFVTAADNSITQYIVQVFRNGYGDCDAQSITLNGKVIPGFDKDVLSYRIPVTKEEAKNLTLEAAIEEGKDITGYTLLNGIRTDGTKITIPELKNGLNKTLINITSENLWTQKQYEIMFIVETNDNNSLLTLDSSIPFSSAFDAEITEYTATTTKDEVTLKVESQHRGSEVVIASLEQTIKGKNLAESTFKLYEGDNKVEISVTAPNGTSKVYKINITANGYAYLSDLTADSIKNGYGNLGYDISNSGGQIKLPDDNGNPVVYEKGLGGHASSDFVYTVADKGYLSFESMVGIDYVQYDTNLSTVEFSVYLDNAETPVWQSGVMRSQTPAKAIKLDLTGVHTIRLVTDATKDGNSYDHADWADAKFIKPLDTAPTDIKVSSIELSEQTASLIRGESKTLSLKNVYPIGATNKGVTWKSDNPAVASVDGSGKVTALKDGSAVITAATVDGSQKSASCTITVLKDPVTNIWVTAIGVAPKTAVLKTGETKTLTVTIAPSTATNKAVTFTSSNTAIATVDSKGVITARQAGVVTITATAVDGSRKSDFSTVTVTNKTVPVTKVTVSPSKKTAAIGSKVTLKVRTYPSNATVKGVTYRSSNTKIASVSSSGKVTAKGIGTATITVTSKDKNGKASFKITVVPKKAAISKVKVASSKSIQVTWKKASGITGYKVYVSTKKNSGYQVKSTIKKAKTTSTVIKNLRKGKKYYVKVAAYKKVNGKTFIGIQSNPKPIIVK